jgi:hypothetical protein
VKIISIFVWYAFGKSKTDSIHCQRNGLLKILTEYCDFVIAISLEIEE